MGVFRDPKIKKHNFSPARFARMQFKQHMLRDWLASVSERLTSNSNAEMP